MEAAYAARFAAAAQAEGDVGGGSKATPPHRRAALTRSGNPLTDSTNVARNIAEQDSPPGETEGSKIPQIKIEPSSPTKDTTAADEASANICQAVPPASTQREPSFSLPSSFDRNAYRKGENTPEVSLASPTPASTASRQTYEPQELRGIGRQCGNRLPPANAVQSMFLYEMQRQTEAEKLFHNLIFENARQEKEGLAQEKRIAQLETRLQHLEKQTLARQLEQRVYKVDLRIDTQEKHLAASSDSIALAEEKLKNLQIQFEEVVKKQEEAASAVATTPEPAFDLQTMKTEIDVLFDDRDGILEMLKDVKIRLDKLEGSTRSLTLQMSDTASVRSSPVLTQRIPAKNTNGDLIDLTIPKGQGLNASIHAATPPERIRSFQPGKPWAA